MRLFLLSFLMMLPVGLHAQSLPRKIVGIFDPAQEGDLYFSRIHQYAEMPLNHLGLEVVYQVVNAPLPTDDAMRGVRGILTWLIKADAVKNPSDYCSWLARQADKGVKIVIWGDFGFANRDTGAMDTACRSLLHKLKLEFNGEYNDNPYFFEIVHADRGMVEFERRLSLIDQMRYLLVRSQDAKARVYLKMRRKDFQDSAADIVFTSTAGGYADDIYVAHQRQDIYKHQWRINPFKYFAEAFSLTGLPRPDTSMINGRRIFYSHIDGDGIFNISHIDRESFSGEIIYREIVKKYSDVPVTASIITGYMDLPEYASERIQTLYRALFSSPNVEPAVHGYAHPLTWKNATVTKDARVYAEKQKKYAQGKLALVIPGYTYNHEKEVQGSVAMINDLLASFNLQKKASLFLWTGNCLPDEDALGRAYALDVPNMNGGDSRFDQRYNSYSFVYPLGIKRGKYRQIYSTNSNENTYTNNWAGPFYGYRTLIETFRKTGEPLLIKPMNIYYHYYSGEHLASLKVLEEAYDYALALKPVALFASEYARLVGDFFDLRMERKGDGFVIHNGGDLRTLRFDNEVRHPDFARSAGIIGYRHYQGALYIYLDEAKEHHIYLTASLPHIPHVREATFQISDFKAGPYGVSFNRKGWHAPEMRLAGMRAGKKYRVIEAGESRDMTASLAGEMSIVFNKTGSAGSVKPVAVSLIRNK